MTERPELLQLSGGTLTECRRRKRFLWFRRKPSFFDGRALIIYALVFWFLSELIFG